jgi:hypothetical protein
MACGVHDGGGKIGTGAAGGLVLRKLNRGGDELEGFKREGQVGLRLVAGGKLDVGGAGQVARVGIEDAYVSCAACAVRIGGRIVFQGWFGINHVLTVGQRGKTIGSFAVGFGDGCGSPDGAAVLDGAPEQVDRDSLRRVTGGELDEAVNGRGGLQSEDQVGHLRGDLDVVHGAGCIFDGGRCGGARAIAIAGFRDLNRLRANGDAGNFEAAVAISEGACFRVAFNAHQRAGDGLAGSGVDDFALHGYLCVCGEACGRSLCRFLGCKLDGQKQGYENG